MKKTFQILILSLILTLAGTLGIYQKTSAAGSSCPVHGQYHAPNNTKVSTIAVYVNGTRYTGTLWTCDCGSELICCDYNGGSYTYPSLCDKKESWGYPYTPGSYIYYVVKSSSYIYYGTPSNWINVH